jgi:REP element-mobilizing transposase RayT
MSRKLRIEYPGAMYHVMNRGDQREDIFRDDDDRQKFLCTLGEACAKTEWQVYAYCLMRNHFHLVLETPQPNLVFGMKWLLGVYTSGKGIPKDSEAGRRQFGLQMERRRAEESAADYEQIRRDWVLGSEAFRQELLAAAVERVGPSHYGAQRQETGLQKAERMVKEELARLCWDEDQLRARRKGHRAKVMLTRRLRQETTMSLKWIAQRLQMGSWTYVSNLLNEPPTNTAPRTGDDAVVSIVRTED